MQRRREKSIDLLDDSGVADVISPYVRNGTPKGGRHGFNYYYLFATILYSFAFKKYTLRELEEGCEFDLRFIYLMDQQRPSYSSICEFINKVIAPNEERIFALVNRKIVGEVGIDLPDADTLVQFQPLAWRHLAVFGEADLQFINQYRKKLGHKEFSSIKELERYFLGLPDLVMEFDGPVTELLFEKGTKKELESWRSKSTKEEGRNG